MNNKFLLFIIVLIFNYFTIVYSENANYIIAILRNKSDKNYNDESPKVQNEIDKLVNDKMNDIYDVIIENQDTYVLENGKVDEKLEELNSLPLEKLEKRNGKKRKFIFKNRTRPNNHFQKRFFDSINSGNSTEEEYIPIESTLVNHVCPVLNYYVVSAYLSDDTVKMVRKMKNVISCEKSRTYKPLDSTQNEYEKNKNISSNDENKDKTQYYDIEAIKKETNWSNVEVQPISFETNHLSLISQSPYVNHNKTFDNNFYYPSSAGQGIDIYFLDKGLIVNHEDFDTYKGTTYERTITCDAIATYDELHITNEKEKKNCNGGAYEFPDHGIMVSSVAGGTIYGVSKKANLHMIAIDYTVESILKGFDYVSQYGIPHKTILSLSLGGPGYSKIEYNKLQELVQNNIIIIAAAGNNNKNCCGDKYSENFLNMAGYRTAIIVGATDNNIENNEYKKASYSNYGDCVDIYAPGDVIYPYIFDGSTKDYTWTYGTSCATPIVAGVAASIMSEHPEIKFNNELMKKKLIEMSIKDVIVDLKKKGSKDTPNRFINNGKLSIYSPDDGNIYCGILSNNKTLSCLDGCCNKEGKCVNFQNDPWNQCLIENGCQSEFGYCTSKDKSVNECENELKEYEECLIDISSDMDKEDLMNKCLIIKSDRCDTFYKHQFTNQSVCSIAKYNYNNNNNNNNNNNSYNTSFDFIKNYNQEKYKKYINLCDENLDNYKEECLNNISHIDQYRKCGKILKSEFDIKIHLDELLDVCNNYDFNTCFNLYENATEIISEIPSCSYIKNNYSLDTIFYDLLSFNNLEDKYEIDKHFYSVYCKKAYTCENELKEFEECQFEITYNMNDDNEIINKCKMINSDKCQKLYYLQDNENSECRTVPDQFELDYNYNLWKYKEMDYICEHHNIKNYESECNEYLSDYTKCFENDINQLYLDDPNSYELSQSCSDFKSKECIEFYKNPESIINEIPSCSNLNKLSSIDFIFDNLLNTDTSTLQYYNKTFNEICEKIPKKNEEPTDSIEPTNTVEISVDWCENELEELKKFENYEKCLINISTDMNDKDILIQCNKFINNQCDIVYNELLNVKSECPSVNDQYSLIIKDFNEEKLNENNDICNEIIYKYEYECNKSFDKYEKCFYNNIEYLYYDNPNSNQLKYECKYFKSDECNNVYENIDEIIKENTSCSLLKEVFTSNSEYNNIYINNDAINEIFETCTNICENVNSNNNENELMESCEKELKIHKECPLNINSDMNDDELLDKCEIFKRDSCLEFYEDLCNGDSSCLLIKDREFETINNFNWEKYNEFDNICFSIIDQYENECKDGLSIYNKCFDKDLEEIYKQDPNSKEFQQGCLDLQTEECIKFYKNPKDVLKEIPSCFTYSEHFSPDDLLYLTTFHHYYEFKDNYKLYKRLCKI